MMLEKLDDVNWTEIKSAVSTADKIPSFVRGLISTDLHIQEESYIELQEFINHQGGIYEATSYTIPFLYEILPLDIGKSQELIIALIGNSVTAPDYWGEIDSIKLQPFEAPVMDAIAGGFDVLLSFLGNGKFRIQIKAIQILTFICVIQNEKIPQVVTKLKQIINSDIDEPIRAVAIYNLGRLYEAMKINMHLEKMQLIDLFKQNWQANIFSLRSFASAVSLCPVMESDLPTEIEDYLIKVIVQLELKRPDDIYVGDGILVTATGALLALWNLGEDRSIVAVGKAIRLMKTPKEARRLSVRLLGWILYRDPLSRHVRLDKAGVYPKLDQSLDVSILKPHHKQAFLTVIDSEIVWTESTNLLELYGLPADRDKARQLLAE